ncbi:MAG TPA: glutathione S-transferase [Allosphingosinicella sp.]|jgi:glutathione S-transferase
MRDELLLPAQGTPILYSFRRCPYAMRARFALAVAGMRYELREVKLREKPAPMLTASPKGTVPVFVVPEGEVIDESLEVMRWALSRCDPEGWLQRDDAALIAANDEHFKIDLDAYKYPERHTGDPLEHRDRGLAFLRILEFRLSASDQLSGSARGVTDAAIMPFVRQFSAVDRDWFDSQQLPHLRAWLNNHLRSDLFKLIMLRTAPWAPGDPATYLGATN